MSVESTIFQGPDGITQSDSCDALREASDRGEIQLGAFARGAYPGTEMPEDVLPGVCSVGFWDSSGEQDWRLDWHRNEGIEITFLARGSLDYGLNSFETVLRPGHVTVNRPWQRHWVGNPHITPSRLHWLILDVAVRHPHSEWVWPDWVILPQRDLEELTEIIKHTSAPVIAGDPEMGRCFEKIAEIVSGGQPGESERHLRCLINELLVLLLESYQSENLPRDPSLSSAEKTVALFLEELGQNLSTDWGAEIMAEECGLARTRFSHYVKKLVNVSPAEYLATLRLDAAEELLRYRHDLDIGEIAARCGFRSGSYFATKFRISRGVSPSSLRE